LPFVAVGETVSVLKEGAKLQHLVNHLLNATGPSNLYTRLFGPAIEATASLETGSINNNNNNDNATHNNNSKQDNSTTAPLSPPQQQSNNINGIGNELNFSNDEVCYFVF
jgi:hypothetical protein